MKRLLPAALCGLFFAVSTARAAFQQVFMIGLDNNTQSEFEQENALLAHYYWENGNYTALGGVNWTGAQETFGDQPGAATTNDLGFPRALVPSYTQTNIYFNLDANEAGANQPIRLTLDLISLGGGSVHDLDVRLNAAAPFAAQTGIAAAQTWVINTTAGAMGAVAGPNVLRVRRTGGAGGASPWIQFDYLRLEADTAAQYVNTFTATPSSSNPGQGVTLGWSLFEPTATVSINQGVGDVTANTSGGVGSFTVNPVTTTTYSLTATFNSVSQVRTATATVAPFITSFTRNDPVVRPGELCTLAWTINPAVYGTAVMSINQGVGTITAPGGTGSTTVSPSVNTTYTLSVTFGGVTQTANVTVNTSPWNGIFDAGVDDGSNAEFSHEVAADDNYYFAGDYTSVAGPNQVVNELLNDDTDTNTVAGRTGNPAVGFERAVTEGDPFLNVWFIPNPAYVSLSARHRITVDVLSVGSGVVAPQTHDLEILLNDVLLRTETAITGARTIQFEISGLTSGLHTGPNKFTVRRTGGTLQGFVVFDYMMFEHLPDTPPAVTGITDDSILGTHTIAWTAAVAKKYRVQKSTDGGTTWQDLAAGFPAAGAPGTNLFFEDRVTPFSDPRPAYRVLQE